MSEHCFAGSSALQLLAFSHLQAKDKMCQDFEAVKSYLDRLKLYCLTNYFSPSSKMAGNRPGQIEVSLCNSYDSPPKRQLIQSCNKRRSSKSEPQPERHNSKVCLTDKLSLSLSGLVMIPVIIPTIFHPHISYF